MTAFNFGPQQRRAALPGSNEPGRPHNPAAGRAPSSKRIGPLEVQLAEARNVDNQDPQHGVTLMEAHLQLAAAIDSGDKRRQKAYAAYIAREIRKSQNDAFGQRRFG